MDHHSIAVYDRDVTSCEIVEDSGDEIGRDLSKAMFRVLIVSGEDVIE